MKMTEMMMCYMTKNTILEFNLTLYHLVFLPSSRLVFACFMSKVNNLVCLCTAEFLFCHFGFKLLNMLIAR